MRSLFYVALAVAVLARTHVVAASTNADKPQLMSKTSPDFVGTVSTEPRKRFLRATDPEDVDLMTADEERTKYGSIDGIIKRLNAAGTLLNMGKIENKNAIKAAREAGTISKKESSAVKAFLGLKN
ncbi:secreted RxLR effector peptide protein, putative [Phytophthora infestans T30-4]|uniref:RxLR effector protein n=1 Tax=Phytophthora infestans (strain T30-4) TaxID=403677 RepID=D0NXV7_PHYIT|nr:secreted RxLR effector peptide protein, putative [Phytophthora infestans T30-4]EEY67908.1 secreted RxLR effector peptide protein, putative [Phytophthora infestans T30-4]|eukprot:XP_002997770.1 secreted RxLR effector peptide protein, putative [Phytophthora infestans T30-4]